jgi:hypothetical protein
MTREARLTVPEWEPPAERFRAIRIVYSNVVVRLAAFAKASACLNTVGPVEALAETGPDDPVFQRRQCLHERPLEYWMPRFRGA